MTNHFQLISQKQAKQLGLVRYYTGSRCLNNHDSQRFTSNGTCCQCKSAHDQKYQDSLHEKELAVLAIEGELIQKVGQATEYRDFCKLLDLSPDSHVSGHCYVVCALASEAEGSQSSYQIS